MAEVPSIEYPLGVFFCSSSIGTFPSSWFQSKCEWKKKYKWVVWFEILENKLARRYSPIVALAQTSPEYKIEVRMYQTGNEAAFSYECTRQRLAALSKGYDTIIQMYKSKKRHSNYIFILCGYYPI